MNKPEHDAPEQRTECTRPQPNPLFEGPATVADCAADYEAAADIRARLDKQS
ncbi:hypothetical protein [Streptomyces pacificus]|uniref:Uncharacterized protein n=1 Tax=Streptomyces pacificus TaxID=2705029 RepID=A0A6A0AUM0_9ACTN|nr:hypothetical protein [Streptomyces pacificus]GFH36612.1 hypothetical protein SCWH03_28430 [Streptomyces pacificus]